MKHTKWTVGFLAALMLTGCGNGTANTGSNVPVNTASVPLEEDLVYQTVGIPMTDTMLTVDGTPIIAEKYCYMLAALIQSEEMSGQTIDWDTRAGEIKEEARDTAVLYQVIEDKCAEKGIALTEEQEEELEDQIQQQEETLGADLFELQLAQLCLTRDGLKSLNRVYYLYQDLVDKMREDGELTPSDEELESYVQDEGIYGAKHILISTRRELEDGTMEEFSDEEKAQAKEQANDLYQQIMQSGNDTALFDQLMREYSGDGRDEDGNLYYPDGYTVVRPGEMVPEFEEGTLALEIGEVSEPVETRYGYHIILRVPVDMESVADEYATVVKLSEVLDRWVEQAEVKTTPAYDDLDAQTFSAQLESLLEERYLSDAEAGTETDTDEGT